MNLITENINIGEDKPSSSGMKEENTYFPTPSYQRRDELHKQLVAQNGNYLDLTNINFKDQIKVIYDWAQSLSIIVSNYKNTWTKENFLDYLVATLQGYTVQWLKQWKKSKEGKQQKIALLANFFKFRRYFKTFR